MLALVPNKPMIHTQSLVDKYKATLKVGPEAAGNYVNTLANVDRIRLRQALESAHCQQLTRNLYYNYSTQEWI